MKILNIISILIIGLAVAAIGFRLCVVKIQPGQVGVLNDKWGGGLRQQDYGPGYYLALGPLHDWKVMDSTVQTLNMLQARPGKGRNRRSAPRRTVSNALKVKSGDGADVSLDITIKYRIASGKAWQVFKEQGAERYKILVANRSSQTLRSEFGKMIAEEFYSPKSRDASHQRVMEKLIPELAEIHVELIGVLIRDLEFQKSFQARIIQKTLTKQNAKLQVSQSAAAREKGKTEELRAAATASVIAIEQTLERDLTVLHANNDFEIRTILADAERKITEISSTADLYAREMEAKGIRLLREAEADGQRWKRDALAAEGGDMLVALRLVENLSLGSMQVSTQSLDPLDIGAMMQRLGAK